METAKLKKPILLGKKLFVCATKRIFQKLINYEFVKHLEESGFLSV